MYPILFQIGEISIYSYGVIIALAILVAALALYREAPREGINPDHVLEAIIVAAIAGLVGARLLYVILNFSSYKGRLLEAFFTRFEGLSFYGAFIGGVLGVLLWARWRRVEFFKIADLFAPYLALGYAFGRVGCFLNGCCYGKVSDVPWALPAPWAADNLLHHPVQLYAALGGIIIFVILKLLRPVRPFSGFLLLALAALYGCLRFTTEFFREEPVAWLGLTAAQLFSITLTVVAVALIVFVQAAGSNKKASTR